MHYKTISSNYVSFPEFFTLSTPAYSNEIKLDLHSPLRTSLHENFTSTPGRQWSPGASPSPSSDCLEGAEQASVSCIFTCVQPHWCHFGKQGTELLLTFVGKRVRTRQKEVMESVACFVPVGISRTKDGAEISLLQSNRGTE